MGRRFRGRPGAREVARESEKGERQIDALLGHLAVEVEAAVAAVEGAIGEEDHAAIMERIDLALDRVYGVRSGSPSAMESLIVGRTRSVSAKAIRRASQTLWDHLEREEPILLAAVEGRMRRGDA